jgi:serine protease Do
MFREPQRVYPKGIASGVLIDKRGYILTNSHVVEDAAAINVTLEDGRSFPATVLGKDRPSDLAILKVNGDDLPAAELGDSAGLHVGDWAIAVGNPLGFESSVSLGVISATARENVQIGDETLERVIQTDAAINPGNSGGALANISGKVIGINTAIASTSGGSIGIGFAIPINSARQIAAELIDHGYVRRAWTGIIETISIGRISPGFRTRSLKYEGSDGVLIKSLYRGSPADKAGLEPYDIIVGIGGHKIGTSDDIDSVVREMSIGTTVDVVFYRFGEKKTTKIRLSESPGEQPGSRG